MVVLCILSSNTVQNIGGGMIIVHVYCPFLAVQYHVCHTAECCISKFIVVVCYNLRLTLGVERNHCCLFVHQKLARERKVAVHDKQMTPELESEAFSAKNTQ